MRFFGLHTQRSKDYSRDPKQGTLRMGSGFRGIVGLFLGRFGLWGLRFGMSMQGCRSLQVGSSYTKAHGTQYLLTSGPIAKVKLRVTYASPIS